MPIESWRSMLLGDKRTMVRLLLILSLAAAGCSGGRGERSQSSRSSSSTTTSTAVSNPAPGEQPSRGTSKVTRGSSATTRPGSAGSSGTAASDGPTFGRTYSFGVTSTFRQTKPVPRNFSVDGGRGGSQRTHDGTSYWNVDAREGDSKGADTRVICVFSLEFDQQGKVLHLSITYFGGPEAGSATASLNFTLQQHLAWPTTTGLAAQQTMTIKDIYQVELSSPSVGVAEFHLVRKDAAATATWGQHLKDGRLRFEFDRPGMPWDSNRISINTTLEMDAPSANYEGALTFSRKAT